MAKFSMDQFKTAFASINDSCNVQEIPVAIMKHWRNTEKKVPIKALMMIIMMIL